MHDLRITNPDIGDTGYSVVARAVCKYNDIRCRFGVVWGCKGEEAFWRLILGSQASHQTSEWLIAARALGRSKTAMSCSPALNSSLSAGVGGGGIVSAVWVITAEIVEVERRAVWSQALSITWSCSAVAGPLLGGVFSGSSG